MDTHKDQAQIKTDLIGIIKSLGIRDSNIYFHNSLPEERLKVAIDSFAPTICRDDVIAFVDNTILNTGREGLIITPDRIFIRNILYSPHMYKIRNIKSWGCKNSTLKFGERNVFDSIRADVNKVRIIITAIREYMDAYGPDEEPETPVQETFSPKIATTETVVEKEAVSEAPVKKIKVQRDAIPSDHAEKKTIPTKVGRTEAAFVKSDGPKMVIPGLVAPLINKGGGYLVVIVALLRDKGPDKVLDIISRFPVIGAAGLVGKLVLAKPLQWINDQMKTKGEAYMMKGLVEFWQANGVSRESLEADIHKLPDFLIDDDLKQDSFDLLDKFLPGENLELPESTVEEFEETCEAEMNICPSCGAHVSANSKFCPNCGNKMINEYKCPSCGHVQKEKMKFCPECGSPVEA